MPQHICLASEVFMKSLRALDWLMMFCLLILFGLGLSVFTRSYDLLDLLELQNLRAMSNVWTSAEMDSLSIRGLKSHLVDDERNRDIQKLLANLEHPDSLESSSRAKIISLGSKNWQDLQDATVRRTLIKSRSYREVGNRYWIGVEHRGILYQAVLQSGKIAHIYISHIFLNGVLLSLLFLIPAISSKSRSRIFFILGYFSIWAVFMLNTLSNYMYHYNWGDTAGQILSRICFICLMIPFLQLLPRKLWYIGVIVVLAQIAGEILSLHNLIFVAFALLLLVLVWIERGINRKYYLQFLLFLAYNVIIIVSGIKTVDMLLKYSSIDSIWRTLSQTPIYNLLLSTVEIGLNVVIPVLLFLLIAMLCYRLIRINIKLLERVYKYIFIVFLAMFIAFILILLLLPIYERIDIILIIFVGSIIIGYALSRILVHYLPLFRPVRFSLRTKSVEFMDSSYAFTDAQVYTEYFLDFLKKLNPRYRIAFYSPDLSFGDSFERMSEERLYEVIKQINPEQVYLNIDLEILNESILGKEIQDFDHKEMPHLLIPIYDDKSILRACFAFGKAPGIYWQESLCKALGSFVSVFRGFYLNMLAQNELREQSINLIKEQEARIYNENLSRLTQEKNALLEEEKRRIMESITYAALIQKSILPPSALLERLFPEHFVIWKPRDIVGGDIYWLYQIPQTDKLLVAVVDCTGHSVPGALMSVAAVSALDRIVKGQNITMPAEILSSLHQSIGSFMHQQDAGSMQDGMDIGIIRIDPAKRKLTFCGAKHQLLVYEPDNSKLQVIPGNKASVGGQKWKEKISFAETELSFSSQICLYLYSDGITDQVAKIQDGKKQRLGNRAWQDYVASIADKELSEQQIQINTMIEEMLGLEEQRDDICIFGLKI